MMLNGIILIFAVVPVTLGSNTAVTQNGDEERVNVPDKDFLLIATLKCPSSSTIANVTYHRDPSESILPSRTAIVNSPLTIDKCGIGYISQVEQPRSSQALLLLTLWDPAKGSIFSEIGYPTYVNAATVTVRSEEPVKWTVCGSSDIACFVGAIYSDFSTTTTTTTTTTDPATPPCTKDVCNQNCTSRNGSEEQDRSKAASHENGSNQDGSTKDGVIVVLVILMITLICLICLGVYSLYLRQRLMSKMNLGTALDTLPVRDESGPEERLEK